MSPTSVATTGIEPKALQNDVGHPSDSGSRVADPKSATKDGDPTGLQWTWVAKIRSSRSGRIRQPCTDGLKVGKPGEKLAAGLKRGTFLTREFFQQSRPGGFRRGQFFQPGWIGLLPQEAKSIPHWGMITNAFAGRQGVSTKSRVPGKN